MTIEAVCIDNYRSVRHAYVPLRRVNVVVGPNGSGKTNLYRGMYLIHRAAQGGLGRAIGEEGGMRSALWAGPRKVGPVRMVLAVRFDSYSYVIECGLPRPENTRFFLDPEVKEERIVWHDRRSKKQILGRKNGTVWARDASGERVEYPMALAASESVLAEIREPHRFPELSALQREILGWRFYHHFRTDAASPLRQPQAGVRTPVLSHDGRDLTAALQTILEMGEGAELLRQLDAAFPGAELQIAGEGRLAVELRMPRMPRFFEATELSDGTLQYLCLLAALLSPRPPALLAVNEPETSIHPDLIPALARLVVNASQRSQIWLTTHSTALADAIAVETGEPSSQLEKVEGETRIVGQSNLERLVSI